MSNCPQIEIMGLKARIKELEQHGLEQKARIKELDEELAGFAVEIQDNRRVIKKLEDVIIDFEDAGSLIAVTKLREQGQ